MPTYTDKQIRDKGFLYIPEQQYLTDAFTIPTTDDGSGDGGGGGGGGGSSGGGGGGSGGGGSTYGNLMTDYSSAIDSRQNRLQNPDKFSQFLAKYGIGGKQRSVDQMMRDSTAYNMNELGPTKQQIGITNDMTGPEIKNAMDEYYADETSIGNYPVDDPLDVRPNRFGLSGILSKILPSAYYDKMTMPEQIYTQSKMGYTGPTVFGDNNSGLQKDIFGRNVISGFGNYSKKQAKDIEKLDDLFSSESFTDKYGNLSLEEDEDGIFSFAGGTAAQRKRAADMHRLNLMRYNYDKQGLKELEDIKDQTGFTDIMEAQNIGDTNYGITENVSDADYTGGGNLQTAIDNARRRSDNQDQGNDGPGQTGSSDYSGQGEDADWGGGEKDGGFIDGTNRRMFAYGGLASIL